MDHKKIVQAYLSVLVEELLSKIFCFIYRENDEEVGVGEVDDRVRTVTVLSYLNKKTDILRNDTLILNSTNCYIYFDYTFNTLFYLTKDNVTLKCKTKTTLCKVRRKHWGEPSGCVVDCFKFSDVLFRVKYIAESGERDQHTHILSLCTVCEKP